jgi:hypothetical protein
MNCPREKNDNETAECPQVCFDAPNCDAELGQKIGDVLKWKIDQGRKFFEENFCTAA